METARGADIRGADIRLLMGCFDSFLSLRVGSGPLGARGGAYVERRGGILGSLGGGGGSAGTMLSPRPSEFVWRFSQLCCVCCSRAYFRGVDPWTAAARDFFTPPRVCATSVRLTSRWGIGYMASAMGPYKPKSMSSRGVVFKKWPNSQPARRRSFSCSMTMFKLLLSACDTSRARLSPAWPTNVCRFRYKRKICFRLRRSSIGRRTRRADLALDASDELGPRMSSAP
mmetsp:Transcript_23497/g.64777  ORF Transcript_23497/g.64777 Transcript_23497/m.64777 type:complete len:228 (-) Transcript_23497:4740-5423(-)